MPCVYNFSLVFFFAPTLGYRGSVPEAIAGFLRDTEEMLNGEPPDAVHLLPEYDFIIIGAGTAGCVLSNRLTEVEQFKVLLIEAGGSEQVYMDIPVLATLLQFTDANWNYFTEPQVSYHHKPINFLTAGAQGIGRLGHGTPRGPSADLWVLTI
ncbi:hypothetical protein evm_005104 [Chilo suppressalis]|nr:hypothetical protein evm_005104 [Chilo suppressalis]